MFVKREARYREVRRVFFIIFEIILFLLLFLCEVFQKLHSGERKVFGCGKRKRERKEKREREKKRGREEKEKSGRAVEYNGKERKIKLFIEEKLGW